MVEFYTQLQQGQSKAESMQTAFIRLRERRPHPYHCSFLLIKKG